MTKYFCGKYTLFLVVVLFFSVISNAQELKVVSFAKDLTDVAARSNAVKDGNGDVCALIKVSLPVEGCKFDGNIVGKPEFNVNEYRIYMTQGSKKLEIRCPGCESLNAEFGTSVETATTYRLKLSGYDIASSRNQQVTFKITPPDATLIVDQKEYATTNGIAQIMLSPDEHTYTVIASGYNVQGSKFMVYENNVNKIIVELDPKAQSNSSLQPTQTNVNTTAPIKSNTINGHEYVDLGLPSGIKWATCNIGASSPSDYGEFFAWGETSTKSVYREKNSKTNKGREMGDISGNPKYDAAHAKWGRTWRLPTKKEFEELKEKCNWAWTIQGGHHGYKVTGPNGNSIFLPSGGWRRKGEVLDVEGYGNYWSSTPNNLSAYYLYFSSSSYNVYWGYRYSGFSVRPVSE